MKIVKSLKKAVARVLPERFVWFLSRSLYNIGYYKPLLWDIAQSERVVEYPWVLKNIIKPGCKILDVGCGGTYFPIVLSSLGHTVWAIDKKPYQMQHPNFKFIQGNVLDTDLPKGHFDVITMISTMEHIGLANDGDFDCVSRLYDLLKSDGILIVSAPFGKAATFSGYRVYDMNRVRKLWKGKIEKIDFFKVNQAGNWIITNEQDAAKTEMESRGECKSIFCAVLRK